MKEKLADISPDIKYIDPTYMVRACPTNGSDAVYGSLLGQNAVHAAFAGLSGVTGGSVHASEGSTMSRSRRSRRERGRLSNGRMWESLVGAAAGVLGEQQVM